MYTNIYMHVKYLKRNKHWLFFNCI